MMSEATPADAPKKVFVVSPIGQVGTETYQQAYYFLQHLVREALPEPEWEVHRADDSASPDSIGQHVVKSIDKADLVVADLTGHNPNVFYELAIAHGWRKPVVHFITKGENVPFDIVDQRTIFYDITDLGSVAVAKARLREAAQHALEHQDELVTPLTQYERFTAIRSDPEDGGDAVADALETVTARLAAIERRLSPRRYEASAATSSGNTKKSWGVSGASGHIGGSVRDDDLTGRENEIADLVLQGLTNVQIAEQLFVSERTVEGHLHRIMAGLNVEDRDELIALLNRRR